MKCPKCGKECTEETVFSEEDNKYRKMAIIACPDFDPETAPADPMNNDRHYSRGHQMEASKQDVKYWQSRRPENKLLKIKVKE